MRIECVNIPAKNSILHKQGYISKIYERFKSTMFERSFDQLPYNLRNKPFYRGNLEFAWYLLGLCSLELSDSKGLGGV